MKILFYIVLPICIVVALFAIAAVMVGGRAEKAMQNIFKKERDEQ